MNDNRGFLSTYAHGVLDYIIGLALVFAPNLFGFADIGGAAEMIPRILGLGILAQAVLTNYELGLFKAIPFRVHRTIDMFAGLYLALSPFIHGFSSLPSNAWMPHVVVGAVILISGIATKSVPESRREMRGAYS